MRKKCKYAHIAVDFDGTLVAGSANFPEPGPQKWIHKIILWWVKRQQTRGSIIIINTLRESSKGTLQHVEHWCQEHDFYPDYYNENDTKLIAIWGDSRKIAADRYLDDRNIGLLGWLLRRVSRGRV